jgi:cytochrome c biogenesis protein CcdA
MVVLLYVAVFAGGLLTIFSPCILPILPFVFSRAGKTFRGHTLPLLVGLVLAFVVVASIGTAGAAWVASAADAGRIAALVLLGIAGASLLSPTFAEQVAHPIVRLGARLTRSGASSDNAIIASGAATAGRALVVGLATGLLWAPCAGPILGLVAAGAAAAARPALAASLFATFGLGAATALGIGVMAGNRILRIVRGLVGGAADIWIRRALGAAAVMTTFVIALGWDASFFASHGLTQTASAEEVVLDKLVPAKQETIAKVVGDTHAAELIPTPDEGPLPSFDGATGWLNTADGKELSREALRGKVVVVNVWTFECYNCLNALPHVKVLAAKYRDQDVVVVGVHTPELARERVPANVASAVARLGVTYPVAIDANYTIWRAFQNEYWPSVYIADRRGRLRFHHFGEGQYDDEDRVVAQLLKEPSSATRK